MNEPYLEIYRREDGLYDWRLKAANGELICSSLQGFRDRSDVVRAVGTATDLFARFVETMDVRFSE